MSTIAVELDERMVIQTAMANMDEGLVVFDAQGSLVRINRAMLRMLSLPGERPVGEYFHELPSGRKLNQMVAEVLEQGKELFSECSLSEHQVCKVHVAGVKGRHGEICGAVAIVKDVTDARNYDQMRSDFAANVSHELRTPLTSIKGFVETLLDGAMEDAVLCRRFLSIIDSEADRLGRLIDDLLTLSSIESRERVMRQRPLCLIDSVRNVLNVMGMQIHDKNQRVEFIYNKELHYIQADEDLINQALINLLDNALKYTPTGGKVVLRVCNSGSRVSLTVSDTGVGMPREALSRIFERFYRVDKARSREQGGTGLGLAIVKHIVDLHGGEIMVDSELGRGTTFLVNFIAL